MPDQATEIKIKYNEPEFDIEHYPIRNWQRDAVAKVHKLLGFGDDVEWWYGATTHSRCFWCSPPCMPNHEDGAWRLMADEVKGLAEIEGLHWIEAPRKDGFHISLAHDLEIWRLKQKK